MFPSVDESRDRLHRAGGVEGCAERVQRWARSVRESLDALL
jgi:hypothetical protein